jgi:hypothetical protein
LGFSQIIVQFLLQSLRVICVVSVAFCSYKNNLFIHGLKHLQNQSNIPNFVNKKDKDFIEVVEETQMMRFVKAEIFVDARGIPVGLVSNFVYLFCFLSA